MSNTSNTLFIEDAPDDGKAPCPECGKRYVPGPGMGVHRHSAHGRTRKVRKPVASIPSNPIGRPPKIDLTVDDIFDVVVGQMYPRGSVPVSALTALLQWRRATEAMLDEVRTS